MSIPRAVQTAFSNAIEHGRSEEVRSILQQHPEIVDGPSWTPPPLHCAVLWNQPDIADILLQHGADIEQRDSDNDTTPLRYAVIYCKPEMIRLLAAAGAATGAIHDGGTTALELARDAAAGAFEEFDDTPATEDYAAAVAALEELTD